ncbi:MAG: isoprenylcysteine carboxylmethyltransferase family protein [Deltaproteobacteria bacterium]|nr:isoprenylcysteine carboxylmethyltransferase family protein [Deltaproteobacteria bacterium]
MDMYGHKHSSLPQKTVIVAIELVLLGIAGLVLFGPLGASFRAFGDSPHLGRNLTLLVFDIVVFARYLATMFVFVERRIPWDEAFSIPLAFALYLVGFPLLAKPASTGFGALELLGIGLFVGGSFINTYAEYQRRRFKRRPQNAGQLYTGGLFAITMHLNYFGDLLWVAGFACVTHNAFAWLIPAFLLGFFYFYNIPKLDAYLRSHYGAAFTAYAQRTKRLVPFVL